MEYEWPVIVRQVKNQYGKQIHYVLNYSEEEQKIRCVWKKVKDLLTGELCQEGDTIVITDWDLKIFEEV